MTVAAQVRDGTAQPNNFDASVINSLFPTPLLDMRSLNAHACNSSLSLADRVQALEVPPPRAHGNSHTEFRYVSGKSRYVQVLEELVQKRDNARGVSRLDGFACLTQVPPPFLPPPFPPPPFPLP
jgi:hypothetical protein